MCNVSTAVNGDSVGYYWCVVIGAVAVNACLGGGTIILILFVSMITHIFKHFKFHVSFLAWLPY